MPELIRYIDEKIFKHVRKDIGFKYLGDKIKKSECRLDLQFRKKYFDLYFCGKRLAEIKYKLNNNTILYTVTIFKDFIEKYFPENFSEVNISLFKYNNIVADKKDSYVVSDVKGRIFKILFDGTIKSLEKNKEIQENFEQVVISDNSDRGDLIIIDRKVKRGNSKEIPLVCLKQIKENSYGFIIVEITSGNDKERIGKIVEAMSKYTGEIREHIDEYKRCYEINYSQKKILGLLGDKLPDEIIIEKEPVDSLLITGGYSGVAEKLLKGLKDKSLKVQWLRNKIDINSNDLAELDVKDDDKETLKMDYFLKNVSGNYAGIYKKWIDNWASASDKFKINMSRRGFSLNVKSSKNKMIMKIIKPLPEAIDLIREKDREELGISKEQYDKYLNEIKTIPSALNVINKNKKECKYNNISPEELDKILKATSELAEDIYLCGLSDKT